MLRWDVETPTPAGFFSMTSPTVHVPVLVEPVLTGLFADGIATQESPRTVVDGTLGGAGHALRLAERLGPRDTLIGIDRDPGAIARILPTIESLAGVRAQRIDEGWSAVSATGCRWILSVGSYCSLPDIMLRLGVGEVQGILLDLGLSSDQLQDTERGFSFRHDGRLDLRFDPNDGLSAAELLQTSSEQEIANLIYRYGEERFSRRIARAIVETRRSQPIETSNQLADLVHRCVPGRVHGRIDSATRTFQALRIAVNRELEHVEHALQVLPGCLSLGGRLAVISFHSLEDRIVKHAMREDPRLDVLTKKPIVAEANEVHRNPRSRSAKLRVSERRSFER
jgi:16S rRNA (cytosine1402-N4)-methyltransferase